jgi:hypothetical protein
MSTPETAITPQAIQEKLAAKFEAKFGLPAPGSSVDRETDAEAVTEAPELAEPGVTEPISDTAEVEWDGAKYTIPAPLREAFEKASDYTRKTQELGEQRRAVDHSRELMTRTQMDAEFQKSVADENRELAVIDAYLSQAAKLNWANMSTDQMMRQRIEVDQVRDRRDELLKSVSGKRTEFDSKMTETLAQLRARAREIAAKSIPNFSEETEKGIKQYAMSEGLSEAETDNVLLDPRSAKILWKASQYDRVRAGTAKAVTATTKAVRPGAASERMPQDVRAKLEYGKAIKNASTSGDKAALIEQRLAASPLFARRK